ncbi:hypothetical protein ES703_24608 [subsurface metagenome]
MVSISIGGAEGIAGSLPKGVAGAGEVSPVVSGRRGGDAYCTTTASVRIGIARSTPIGQRQGSAGSLFGVVGYVVNLKVDTLYRHEFSTG